MTSYCSGKCCLYGDNWQKPFKMEHMRTYNTKKNYLKNALLISKLQFRRSSELDYHSKLESKLFNLFTIQGNDYLKGAQTFPFS